MLSTHTIIGAKQRNDRSSARPPTARKAPPDDRVDDDAIKHMCDMFWTVASERLSESLSTPVDYRQVRRPSMPPACGSVRPDLPVLSAIGYAAGVFADPK